MKVLIIILLTVFTLSIADILYATHGETDKKEVALTEYVHLRQVYQPIAGPTW